ncbi:MAG: low molecular weight protein-tyrosine-phosphatase [Gammaproteobacteria bacterium]
MEVDLFCGHNEQVRRKREMKKENTRLYVRKHASGPLLICNIDSIRSRTTFSGPGGPDRAPRDSPMRLATAGSEVKSTDEVVPFEGRTMSRSAEPDVRAVPGHEYRRKPPLNRLKKMQKTKVLMVCMGNICRSPMAEGMLRRAVQEAGLAQRIEVDSAGTHAYHIGSPPDPRAQQAISRRGVDISGLRGRKVADSDFDAFDYILVMDGENYARLIKRAPVHHRGKVRRLMEFSRKYPNLDVVDPYYGNPQGFEENLDMIEDAVQGLLREIAPDPNPGAKKTG